MTTKHPSAARRKYDLLAIDLDGTLIGKGGIVSARNIDAIHRAREAGMAVHICTGRGLRECRVFLEAIGQTLPVAVAGGSIIADPTSGATLHRFAMDEGLVRDTVRDMHAHGQAALVLKDPAAAEFDYLVVRSAQGFKVDPVMDWWFETMNLHVRYVDDLHEDAHPEHTVRIGAFGINRTLDNLAAALEITAKGRGVFHQFPAVVAPDHHARLGRGESFHILELFDVMGNKWSAIKHMSRETGVPAARVAAIGDEINDVPMIRNAGLGIAMGNAIPAVRAIAARTTLRNDEDGVAHAVDKILEGEW